MKTLFCPICKTEFEFFIRNDRSLKCNCISKDHPEICSGIYIAYKFPNFKADFIQLFYRLLTFHFEEDIFYLYNNGKEIFKDSHYINFSKYPLENIYNQLLFCFKYEESLLFL